MAWGRRGRRPRRWRRTHVADALVPTVQGRIRAPPGRGRDAPAPECASPVLHPCLRYAKAASSLGSPKWRKVDVPAGRSKLASAADDAGVQVDLGRSGGVWTDTGRRGDGGQTN
uniref:Uncharacterized protein n=1 Tax=Zea mays TaxID=4577 RepID=A0A804LCN7_MAIZE